MPSYAGLENPLDLPQASTLCGECPVVCPVKIPLPDLLRKLREKQLEERLRSMAEYLAFGIWSYVAKRPALYHLATKISVRVMKLMGGSRKRISTLPFASGWTKGATCPRHPPRHCANCTNNDDDEHERTTK
jgi:L-lactate dehydrogenase complex protein LldF